MDWTGWGLILIRAHSLGLIRCHHPVESYCLVDHLEIPCSLSLRPDIQIVLILKSGRFFWAIITICAVMAVKRQDIQLGVTEVVS